MHHPHEGNEHRTPRPIDARLRTVLSHAPIVLFSLDDRARFTSLDGRATELAALGLADDGELLDRAVFEVCNQIPELLDSCRLALAGHEHTAAFDRGGQHFEGRYEPLRDADGRVVGMVGALLDVTEHREVEQALARSETLRVEAERLAAMGSLAGGVANQINNALTAARLSLGRLVSFEGSRRPVTPARQHRLEMLQETREALARIERITHELRAFSCVEDAASGLIDVREALDAVLRITAHEIRHHARLVANLGELPAVRGSETALRHVFLNLILNAVQSIPEGAADQHEIRVTSGLGPHGELEIEIADTGVGIPAEQLARVFDPFFTTRPAGHGLGLGLATCHGTVLALGGTIAVDSEVGKGTRVRLQLPPAPPDEAAATVPAPRRAVATGARPARVLIVDDDRPVAAALALELADHDVVVAGSGREALEILRRDTGFDMVLCDLMMPEVSGMDLYQWVRPIEPALAARFVFMTGGAFTARAGRFLHEVGNPRLEKPFATADLLTLVRELAEDHDARDGVPIWSDAVPARASTASEGHSKPI